MIKQTFYNLPETKRQRILNAIINEFNSVSTNHISINRIIKEANISRGSFYQYFDDKSDLYEIIAEEIAERMKDHFMTDLVNVKGDIFKTFELLLENQSKNFDTNAKKKFQSFIPLRNSGEQSIMDKIYVRIVSYSDLIVSNIDTTDFVCKDRSYIRNILGMLFAIYKEVSVFLAFNQTTNESAAEDFAQKIEIIKHGCLR